jgi:hypothetical protein
MISGIDGMIESLAQRHSASRQDGNRIQSNRMNKVVMVLRRLSFRSSPDKGRTGGVGGDGMGVFAGFGASTHPLTHKSELDHSSLMSIRVSR